MGFRLLWVAGEIRSRVRSRQQRYPVRRLGQVTGLWGQRRVLEAAANLHRHPPRDLAAKPYAPDPFTLPGYCSVFILACQDNSQSL